MFEPARLLVLSAIGVLFVASLGVALLRLNRRPLSVMWLCAFGGAGLAWLSILLARLKIPYQILLIPWQNDPRLPEGPALILDSVSWAYAAALASLGLGVILTAVSRLPGVTWRAWAGVLALEGIGILAALAGNPTTLLLAWTALDVFETLIWLVQAASATIRRRVVIAFASRVLGSLALVAAMLRALQEGEPLGFGVGLPVVSPLVVLAVGLRLGVTPLQPPFLTDHRLRQGIGSMLRLAPTAGAFVLLTRAAETGVEPAWLPLFVTLTLVAAFYSALAWVNAPNDLAGRPFWVMLTASLAMMAAIFKQPLACLAWGMVCLLSGGVTFLSSLRPRGLLPVLALNVVGVSMLPFTPAWQGAAVYAAMAQAMPIGAMVVVSIVLGTAQALLGVGLIRHWLRPLPMTEPPQRWIWLLYPPGLAVLLLSLYAIGWVNLPRPGELSSAGWIASLGVWVGTVGLGALYLRRPAVFSETGFSASWGSSLWSRFLSLQWAYGLLGRLFEAASRILRLLNLTLEGRAGLLWALIWLLMLFSLIVPWVRFP